MIHFNRFDHNEFRQDNFDFKEKGDALIPVHNHCLTENPAFCDVYDAIFTLRDPLEEYVLHCSPNFYAAVKLCT